MTLLKVCQNSNVSGDSHTSVTVSTNSLVNSNFSRGNFNANDTGHITLSKVFQASNGSCDSHTRLSDDMSNAKVDVSNVSNLSNHNKACSETQLI